ncbi:MAG TPA: hypothetical protein VJB37_01785, partial [Patescibacteria group bacterium]|nr:hypothetical protein [Patescibacteria group bacterium]
LTARRAVEVHDSLKSYGSANSEAIHPFSMLSSRAKLRSIVLILISWKTNSASALIFLPPQS